MLSGLVMLPRAGQNRHEIQIQRPGHRRVPRSEVVPQPTRQRSPGPLGREGMDAQDLAKGVVRDGFMGCGQELREGVTEQLGA